MSIAITCSDLTFTWSDGTPVFSGLHTAFGVGITGLIGANGSGKSTLLRLIAGELTASAGAISVDGTVGYVAQQLPAEADCRVVDLLGLSRILAAIRAIESGEATAENFTVVGERWDAVNDARTMLNELGLEDIELDRSVREISGGEATLVATAAQLLSAPDVLLLDEPTNSLDADARQRFYQLLAARRGVTVVASHDRELLERVNTIAELRDGRVRLYGGTLRDYQRDVAVEQEAARRAVRDAEADLKRQQRELIEAETKLSHRRQYGKKMWNNKREPKVVMGERKRAAQVSAGKHRGLHQEHVQRAQRCVNDAEVLVRDDALIRIDLPQTQVPATRIVLNLDEVVLRSVPPFSLELRGPERIAVTGPNGVGKTTLLQTIVGERTPLRGQVQVRVPVGYLPQRIECDDDASSVVDSVARAAPAASPNAIRAQLARFLFRGSAADARLGTLSGGERFRATLAKLLLAQPAPQLLVLDEPTNNLDLASVEQLLAALRAYRGALMVASHDQAFLAEIGITRWLRLRVSANR